MGKTTPLVTLSLYLLIWLPAIARGLPAGIRTPQSPDLGDAVAARGWRDPLDALPALQRRNPPSSSPPPPTRPPPPPPRQNHVPVPPRSRPRPPPIPNFPPPQIPPHGTPLFSPGRKPPSLPQSPLSPGTPGESSAFSDDSDDERGVRKVVKGLKKSPSSWGRTRSRPAASPNSQRGSSHSLLTLGRMRTPSGGAQSPKSPTGGPLKISAPVARCVPEGGRKPEPVHKESDCAAKGNTNPFNPHGTTECYFAGEHPKGSNRPGTCYVL